MPNDKERARPLSDLIDEFQEAGYRAKVEQVDRGNHLIRSAAAGWRFSLYLHTVEGTDDQVHNGMFRLFVKAAPELELLNLYNSEHRFCRAYRDDDDDLVLEWDVVFANTGPGYLAQCLERWESVLGNLTWFSARMEDDGDGSGDDADVLEELEDEDIPKTRH